MKGFGFMVFCFTLILMLACKTDENKVSNTLNGAIKSSDSSKSGLKNSEFSVIIGNQEWMTKNLNVDTFINGDRIQELQIDKEWEEAGDLGKPAWSYYLNNKEGFEKKVGKLYNIHAVDDHRGLCPSGWQVPTDEDWIKLRKSIDGSYGDQLKSTSGWFNHGNGTNETGFNALPGGMRYYDGEFLHYGENAFFWTSSNVVITHAWLRYLAHDYGDKIFRVKARRAAGMSVRCMRYVD